MNKELEQMFIKEFPGFFRDMYGHESVTCMHWGIATGDGWYELLWKLCMDIEATNPPEDFKFEQIKEKFGQLRIYTWGDTEEIEQLILKAEDDSARICEHCGMPGEIVNKNGWLFAACENHRS